MTVNEKKIKIFVSHRIDQISETIDNPLYVNVRCGAVYDKRNPKDYENILGDDVGDNISSQKHEYSELTVQYWSWKNVKAEYYGLCHYRRYLSFAESKFETNDRNQIECEYLNRDSANNFGLLNSEKMSQIISQYDFIHNQPFDVRKVNIPNKGRKKSVYEHLNAFSGYMFPQGTIEKLLDIIKKYHPKYFLDCQSYLNGKYCYGYNLFIMKASLFDEFCSFEFDVLSKLKKIIDSTYFSETMSRTLGFMGEVIFGTFITHIKQRPEYKEKELQSVLFLESKAQKELKPAFSRHNIPIVLLSSEYYVPYLGTLLESLKENMTETKNYDVIIFQKAIMKDSQECLKRLVSNVNNISIRFFNVRAVIDDSKFFVSSSFYAVEAYYRILTPWILKNYDKAIVMDCDLVLNEDISKLFDIDISDASIGAVKDIVYQGFLNGFDPKILEYTINKMKMKQPYDYVNTGVMLMNLERIRQKCTEDELISFFEEHHFNIQEQDGLNSFFDGDIKFLDLRWNYYVEVNAAITQSIEWAPKNSKEEYRQINPYSSNNYPFIVHYASQPKPWNSPAVKYAEIWWKYARKTDYYFICLQRMIQANQPYIPQPLSLARRVADKFLPKGSARREALKRVMPRNSPQWNFLKKIYHIFSFH